MALALLRVCSSAETSVLLDDHEYVNRDWFVLRSYLLALYTGHTSGVFIFLFDVTVDKGATTTEKLRSYLNMACKAPSLSWEGAVDGLVETSIIY